MEMVKSQIQELIEKKLADLLGMFGVQSEINSTFENNILRINAKTTNDELFVGKAADPLLALQHLLRVVFKRELSEQSASLVLNIGDFQDRQKNDLETLANQAADQVQATGQPVVLRPMSSYERRLVHVVLAENPMVESVSEGDNATRHIVVKPKP